MDIIIYPVIGWIAVILSSAYQTDFSATGFSEWIQQVGDFSVLFSCFRVCGCFLAAIIADRAKLLNALCVGVLDIVFSAIQLALFERLNSESSFLWARSSAALILVFLRGGDLAIFREKRSAKSPRDYLDSN
jgi:hypothetical protein